MKTRGLCMLAIAAVPTILIGCSSGASSAGNSGTSTADPQNYAVILTATFGSASRTIDLTLIVK